MEDYILFIDTETGGLPKSWRMSYKQPDSWPYLLQIAWIVTTSGGEEVKREDYYIWEEDISIEESSYNIHGITKDLLKQKGKNRQEVMEKLYCDIQQYRPLFVSHFLELDEAMVTIGFQRAGWYGVLDKLRKFCTMKVTSWYIPHFKGRNFLKLGELFAFLFGVKLEYEHNAMVDASATRDCFFEMWKRRDINEYHIEEQQSKNDGTTYKFYYLLVWVALSGIAIWYFISHWL